MNFTTVPRAYQLDVWEKTKDKPYYSIFMEQGTGKSKIALDTATYLFLEGEINGCLIVCPNNMKWTWILQEIAAHFPADLLGFCYVFGSKGRFSRNTLLKLVNSQGLPFIVANYEAFLSKANKEFIKSFLTKKKCLYIVDESTKIKSPGAKRTQSIIASGKYAPYKRILTGTPYSNGPFGAYSQIRFLNVDYWKQFELATYSQFKNRFAHIETAQTAEGRYYPKVLYYRDLDVLKQMLDPISIRVLKKDVLDLPEKIYSTRYFSLDGAQKAFYEQLKEEIFLELGQSEITVTEAIVKLIRLQQVTSGFVGDDDRNIQTLVHKNPRISCLMEICEEVPQEQAIIFAKYRYDIQAIADAIGHDKCAIYDGSVSPEKREGSRQDFVSGYKQYFVANYAVASLGLTLVNCSTVIRYNHVFDWELHTQAEDRAHRIGQTKNVLYIDIVARNTVDEKIVTVLNQKEKIAGILTGDVLKQWLGCA